MKTNKSFISLQEAHGTIPYNMTNDYMFRAVLQSNNKVLRALVGSLLHLKEEEIISAEITNPIILGESMGQKEIRLDINVLLNNNTLINLEMQIANKRNWNNRSLLYLCRSFDRLNRGQDYEETLPAIHIGFLNYSLFAEYPEFYATYKLMNVNNCQIYNDNFTLSVVDLSHIELATEEDKKFHIDYWAKLFKAVTWEEIIMLASKNEYLYEASNTMFKLSADEQIRKRCLDREEYYQDLRNYEKIIAQKDAVINEKDAVINEKNAVINEKDAVISEKDAAIMERDALIHKNAAEAEHLRLLLKEHGIEDTCQLQEEIYG